MKVKRIIKLRTKHRLWIGGILAASIIYFAKIDTTPAYANWMHEMGQYLGFNLAIAYLSSIIFYLVVVYIPESHKKKIFFFDMGMNLMDLDSKAWMIFMYLRNIAEPENSHLDTGNINNNDLKRFIEKINLDTVYRFDSNAGNTSQTFRSYIENYKIKLIEFINNTLTIPYDNLDIQLELLRLRSCSFLEIDWKNYNDSKIREMDIVRFYIHIKTLDCYFEKHFAPKILYKGKKKKPRKVNKVIKGET